MDSSDGHLNTCTFDFSGKRIVLHPLPPMERMIQLPAPIPSTTLLVNCDNFFSEADRDSQILCLTNVFDIPATTVLDSRTSLLLQFDHLCHDPLEGALPPMCNIQHQIRVEPGATLPNLPHYRMTPMKYTELKRHVLDLLN